MRKVITSNKPVNRSPMIINPEASRDAIESEAAARLDNARNMLQGMAAANASGLMVEDLQGACGAAVHLIEDALLMMDRANSLAKESGESQ